MIVFKSHDSSSQDMLKLSVYMHHVTYMNSRVYAHFSLSLSIGLVTTVTLVTFSHIYQL